jgi:hypothetical protein
MNLSTYLSKINNKLDTKTLNKLSFIKYNEINTQLLKIFDSSTDTNKKIYFITQLGGGFQELKTAVLETKRLLNSKPAVNLLQTQNDIEVQNLDQIEKSLTDIYNQYDTSEKESNKLMAQLDKLIGNLQTFITNIDIVIT